MSAAEGARRELLRDTAVVAGRLWFDSWRKDLLRDGRRIEGGWPGTLPEARARAAAFIGPVLRTRRMPNATDEELGWASRATYDEAKRAWLSSNRERGEGGS